MSSTDRSAASEGATRSSEGRNGHSESMKDQIQQAAEPAMKDAKQGAEKQARKYKDRAAEQLRVLSEGVRSGAERIEGELDWAGKPLHAAADRMNSLADRLATRSGGALMRDVEDMARANPGLFYAACAAAGFAAARFLTADTGVARNASGRSSQFEDDYQRETRTSGAATPSASQYAGVGRTGGDNV